MQSVVPRQSSPAQYAAVIGPFDIHRYNRCKIDVLASFLASRSTFPFCTKKIKKTFWSRMLQMGAKMSILE